MNIYYELKFLVSKLMLNHEYLLQNILIDLGFSINIDTNVYFNIYVKVKNESTCKNVGKM
jgi:hypothetical protein